MNVMAFDLMLNEIAFTCQPVSQFVVSTRIILPGQGTTSNDMDDLLAGATYLCDSLFRLRAVIDGTVQGYFLLT